MKSVSPITIAAGVVIAVLLVVIALKFRRWPEGRKRALRSRKRKGTLKF